VPGKPMLAGAWNIPIPREREVPEPDALIVPLLGFDRSCFRLGYGSGFYDRTFPPPAVHSPWGWVMRTLSSPRSIRSRSTLR
jgi:5,10-methenyltetrahydrofolate synthetase